MIEFIKMNTHPECLPKAHRTESQSSAIGCRPGFLAKLTSAFLLCAFAQDANARSASDRDSPEIVVVRGINYEDALHKGFRQAVSQRCGENIKARTIERKTFNKSTSIDEGNSVSGTQDSDVNTKTEQAITTGGIVRHKVIESYQDAPSSHRLTIEVYVEKCDVEGAGRITIKNEATRKIQDERRGKIDPKSFVERETSVNVQYEVPPLFTDAYALKSLVLSVAQNFAISVVKAEVSAGADIRPVSTQVDVLEVHDLEPSRDGYGLELKAKIKLFGVNQEIDGNRMNDRAWTDVSKSLTLRSGQSPAAGFSFYLNEQANNVVVYDVDRRGASLGKILRGDIIETVNGVKMRSIKEFPTLLESALRSGPASLFVRRGSATLLIIIR